MSDDDRRPVPRGRCAPHLGPSWTTAEVVGLGALTGVVAGGLLGVVTGLFVTNGRLRRTRPPVRG